MMLSEALSEIRYRLRALLRRERMERELADELRFHIERDADQYARAGLGRGEALRRARMALGGIDRTKEETRDARGVTLLETVLQDVRYAVRGMRARPAFTASVVLTLALGIGAASGLYTLLDAVLLRPLPFEDSGRLVRLAATRGGVRLGSPSPLDVRTSSP
jgi:hypothetical protein